MACTETGDKLVHWISTRQLPARVILRHLTWKEAVRLAMTCKVLWQKVEWIVALAKPNQDAALDGDTPDRLRIPLLTGLTREQVRANDNRAFRWACHDGHLNVARWLKKQFDLTRAEING